MSGIDTSILVRGARPVPLREVQVPDAWHVAMRNAGADREMILEVWHLAHDLLRHAKGIEASQRIEIDAA